MTGTNRDLSWLDDAETIDTVYEYTEGAVWTRTHVINVAAKHPGSDVEDFLAEEGDRALYLAWAVLDWLGY